LSVQRQSWPRRLHSLTGVVPVGVFVAFHLWENSTAARGADAYNEMARRLQDLPFAVAMEVLLILLPLLYHGVYGLFVSSTARPDVAAGPFVRRWMFFLQRLTGTVVFAFVLFHLWTTRLVQLTDHRELDLFRQVQAAVANPWIFAFYVAGILSATYHLSSGIWSFSLVWGLAVAPRARRRMGWACVLVFLALSWIGLSGIRAFRM